jgi:hypothetical protein
MRSTAARPSAAELRPQLDLTSASPDLPPWSPRTPRGGWTPARARATAQAYAAEVAEEVRAPEARIARAAWRALLSAVPGLRGADIVDRLRRSREIAADELAELDEPAPF